MQNAKYARGAQVNPCKILKHCDGCVRVVDVGVINEPSTITAVCAKLHGAKKTESYRSLSDPEHLNCDICWDDVWTTDDINAVFHFQPRNGADSIRFCNVCLRGFCEAVRWACGCGYSFKVFEGSR